MTGLRWIAALTTLGLMVPASLAGPIHERHQLDHVNSHLHGQIIDFTNNHGQDRRIWSSALCEKRDLYVYLPPGYDPAQRYPIAFWMHMGRQDEKAFLGDIAYEFDEAMACGTMPPTIVVVPDGSFHGEPPMLTAGSFFINSRAGRYGDYLMNDIWEFVTAHFPVRPEREAHVLMGASMGGFGAYNLGFKYADRFKILAGIFPPLNVRWLDCHGHYNRDFDPCCWGWRTKFPPHEVVSCYRGIPILLKHFSGPIFGRRPDVSTVSRGNPIEMLDLYGVKPGQYDMFIGYGGKDELNLDAQIESFLFFAREHGLEVDVSYLPKGRHDQATLLKLLPDALRWLGPKLAPYAPGAAGVKE